MQKKWILWGLLMGGAAQAMAMVAQPTRLTTWHHGESIGGEEFVAANEAIVDYLATLAHPTDAMGTLHYNCMAKVRAIAPSVQQNGQQNLAYVIVQTVYELRDCAPTQ
jgi:hypothetical protein